MTCFACAFEIPESSVADDQGPTHPRQARFKCPKCGAAHIRKLVDHTADGKPVYEVRLWGHPATTRRILRIEGGRPSVVTA
jgi:predicted RNA-binding Zn-ribbon protein involved in translation (DUF1610 family)